MIGAGLTRVCPDEADTLALGRAAGTALAVGDLLSLSGPLGAGKTVLVRGMAAGAGVDPLVVRSPTFVLHHVYRGDRLTVHHLDLYRLGGGSEITLLDLEALLETGVVLVEWGEHADLSALGAIRVTFEVAGDRSREITLDAAAAPARLAAAWGAAGAPP